jgi:hypothetical protein
MAAKFRLQRSAQEVLVIRPNFLYSVIPKYQDGAYAPHRKEI